MVRAAVFASALVLASADFDDFKRKYGKVYNGNEHEAEHKATYEANMRRNDEVNAQNLGYTLGENQFSDLTQEQYRVAAGLGYKAAEDLKQGLPMLGNHVHNGETLAASVNWVTAGAVTPIKDQGQCGSCWAFSTTGSVEGAWQISSGKLVSASEQQLVDCETTYSAGCQGGSMAGGIIYESGVAIATENSYPYTARDGTCKSSYTTAIPAGGITGYQQVGNGHKAAGVADMQSAIQQQPVSIAIEADQYSFQAYSGGILSSGCGTRLDHGVLAVGYGTESGQDYWLVKNSWGTSWGDNGYIKIASATNVCGVLSQPVYPTASAEVAAKEKEVEITLPWLTEGCSNKGHCGLAYQTCCLGFQADGYPCGCHLGDGGTGLAKGDCGDCGAAYTLCCAAYAADGYACTCDVTDGGVMV